MALPKRSYSYRLSYRLSKNYNSVETSIEFSSESLDGEKTAELIERVERVVNDRAVVALADADEALSALKPSKP